MFSKVLTASILSRTSDEDLCSQLNYLWSAYVIAAIGALITMVQFAGNPIYCWCPAEMPPAQCNYTMALCWVQENYYVSQAENVRFQGKDVNSTSISFYPWMPWILLLMSAILNVPHIIWRLFVPSSGLNLNKFISLADSHDSTNNLATILRIWLARRRSSDDNKSWISTAKAIIGSLGIFPLGKHHRTYLCGLVLVVKLLYLLVSIGLYVSLNIFIDEHLFTYGFHVLDNFFKGIPQNPSRFPKETICDIKIRQMSNVHTYSIQCILPINMYNEKIIIFLWFWLIILISINAYSLLKWASQLLSSTSRRSFVKEYIIILFHILHKTQPKYADTLVTDHDEYAQVDRREHNKQEETVYEELDKNDDGCRDNTIDVKHSEDTLVSATPQHHRVTTSRARKNGIKFMRNLISTKPEHIGRHVSSSIETTEFEILLKKQEKKINGAATKMLKHFSHDGVVVFRTLEHAVGIVIANEIFQELYQQMNHYS